MINKVILLGNLGAEPEMRALQSGDKVANLRLATSETWKDRQSGERKERTEWHRISVFDGWAKYIENAEKGQTLYIEGKLVTRKWTDQSGAEKYSTEIQVNAREGKIKFVGGSRRNGGNQEDTSRNDQREDFHPDLDDEIPF